MTKLWEKILAPKDDENFVWEVFHENSKLSKYQPGPSEEAIVKSMTELHECLPFVGYPLIELPHPLKNLSRNLSETLTSRRSSRQFIPGTIDLQQLSTILYFGYGVSREKDKAKTFRSLRFVPSGGSLYPLEIFFYAGGISNLKPGLYHYNPIGHHLRLIKEGDATTEISSAMVQEAIIENANFILFISAVFERSIFKYGNRGYRFIFLEAGHFAQNINLISQEFGLGCLNIGGYFDRQIDDLLDLDGLTQSTIYMCAIGKSIEQ